MKTLTLFFFIVFATLLTANAQITKGNWMVGGDVYFATKKFDSGTMSNTTNEIRIDPNIGYFFIDNLVTGLQMNIAFTNTDPGNSTTKDHSYGFAPFARYYFLESKKTVNIFTEASYSFSFGKIQSTTNVNWNGYGLKAGAVMFLNSNVGVEFSLNYTDTTRKLDDFKIKSFLVGIGLQIHLEK